MAASGFYKLDGTELLYARNFVLNSTYELQRSNTEDRQRTVDGWQWFDSYAEARTHHGLPSIYEMPEEDRLDLDNMYNDEQESPA